MALSQYAKSGNFKHLLVFLLVGVVSYQTYLIGERVLDAMWQYMKFKDYGGGGHITVNWLTQLIFYSASSLILFCGFRLRAYFVSLPNDRWALVLTTYSVRLLLFISSIWAIVLVSPLARFP